MANELKIDGKYTVKGAKAILGIGESTVWRWIREGKLKPVYQRARVLFDAEEIRKLTKNRTLGKEEEK